MKRMLLLFFVIFSNFLLSQGTKEISDLEPFNSIEINDKINAEIIITKGDSQKVYIETQNTKIDLEDIVVKSKNDILEVKLPFFKSFSGDSIFVKIYTPAYKLLKIKSSGGAEIKSSYIIDAHDDIKLEAYTGALMDLNIVANNINIGLSTGSKIRLKGKADKQEIEINTGSFYYGKEFKTKQTSLKMLFGGTAEVFATDALKADTGLSGSLTYYGNPKEKEFQDKGIKEGK